MKKFTEYPMTVYVITHTNKVRKMKMIRDYNEWSKGTVAYASTGGYVRAADAHLTFEKAAAALTKQLQRKKGNLLKALEGVNQDLISIAHQLANHKNPPKKGLPCPSK